MSKKAIHICLKEAIEKKFDFIEKRFENLVEMNESFQKQRTWIFEKLERRQDYKRRLSRVLEVIKMFACKYIGFCYLSENRLVAEYQRRHCESISKRTVGTCIKHLREIGFVTTIAAKREDGKQTSNIIVLERFNEGREKTLELSNGNDGLRRGEDSLKEVAHKEEGKLRTNKTKPFFKASLKEHKERIAKERRLLNFVPQWFKDQIASCARDARRVYEYWKITKGMLGKAFVKQIKESDRSAVLGAAVREFYKAVKASTRGAFEMRNPYGFFHSVLEAEAHAHIRRSVQGSSLMLFDWVNQER